MTLIVATDESDAGFFASQTISELMHEHPSRGIVLTVSDTAERSLEARVLAQCWKPFGKAQQICCEQIEIKARPETWPNVGPTLIGLTAADLPVIFWCRHQGALNPAATRDQKAGLEAVMSLATKTIVDNAGMKLKPAFSFIAYSQSLGRIIADLEWTRLTFWREPLAGVFDSGACASPLSTFDSVEVAHTDAALSASTLYIAGWLSAPYKPTVSFQKVKGYGPGIHRVTLRSEKETIDFERTGADCMTLRSSNGRSRQYNYPDADLSALMTEELSVLGPDPAFNAAFSRSQELLRELK